MARKTMRQLLLMRHAKSSSDDPNLPDHARPLNARGRRSAAAMRRAMRELALTPEIVLVSSARRALQTLEALEPWDETPLIEPMDTLYLATAPQMLRILQSVAETARSVMIIGHNPGIHDLAIVLADARKTDADKIASRVAERYPTGALAEFSVVRPWWQVGEGGARLVRFVAPRDLPERAASS